MLTVLIALLPTPTDATYPPVGNSAVDIGLEIIGLGIRITGLGIYLVWHSSTDIAPSANRSIGV